MNRVQKRTLILGAALGIAIPVMAQDRLAYVDMETVFQGFYKTARSDATFKKRREVCKEHADNLAAEIEVLKEQRDELQEQALNIALSEEVRQKHRREAEEKNALYQEKRQELKEFLRKTDEELMEEYRDLRAELVKEITAFIREYSERQGFASVLDSSGLTRNFIPVVIYHDAKLDITDTVLAELNRGHEDEVPAPAPAADAAGGGDAAEE